MYIIADLISLYYHRPWEEIKEVEKNAPTIASSEWLFDFSEQFHRLYFPKDLIMPFCSWEEVRVVFYQFL